MPEITLRQDANEIGLAAMLSDLISQNLDQAPEKISVFNSLEVRVQIEANDIGVTVGLEFMKGSLAISGNSMIQRDLQIIADSTTILDLCLLKVKFGLPYFFDGPGFKVLKKLLTGQLIIKGMLRHFSTLIKLTKIFSVIRK